MASDKLYIYDSSNVTVITNDISSEVVTIYERGPQGPRGEKGDTPTLPTEIISGSGTNNLLALFVSGGYITGSNNLSFDGSNLNISGSVYISTFSGSAVSLAGISQDNNLTNITIGSGLNLLDNTLNAVGSLTGTGSITQLAFWTASKAISGSQNLVYDYTNNRLGINNSNPQYALDVSGTIRATSFEGLFPGIISSSQQVKENLPLGTVSGSNQLTSSYDVRYELRGSNIVSGSSQVKNLLPDGTVSGSNQLTSSYDLRYELKGSNIVSSSGQVKNFLPTDVVSSSVQIKSFLPLGTVSGSTQLTSSYDLRYELKGSNIVSGSSQVKNLLPDGTVSSSAQISADISGSFLVTSASFSSRITGIENKTGSFATTGSNIFFGNQIINGSILAGTFTGSAALITGDVLVEGKVTAREFFTQYISSSIIYQSGSTKFGDTQDDTHQFTGSIYLSGSLINVSHIDFSTSSVSPNSAARITWNPDFGTLDLGVVGGNVNLSWGLEVAAYVVNGESTTLLDGEVVYMSGSRGDKPKVYRASSLTELTSTKTFGVVTEHILSNQLGYVTTQGVVNGLNLGSFNPGDAVWLGTTPGTFTVTKPQAPTHSVFVGIVQRANAGAGQLYVRVQNGFEIDELHNVRITNPLNGQLLTYNQAQQIWVNGNTLSGSYFVSGSIQATSFTGSLLGTASYADIIRSGGVLGSGGANQVAFWSDTGSLTGNSLILVESANNRFRIGNIYYGTSGITTTQGGSAASIFMSSANRNINMDGNVGIGTSPAATLHVSGSSGSGLFEIDSDSAQNIIYVSGSGNVGINTNNPTYKLDVIGNGRFRGSGTTSATTAFLVQNNTPSDIFSIKDNGETTIGGQTTVVGTVFLDGMTFRTATSTGIVNSGGNFLIQAGGTYGFRLNASGLFIGSANVPNNPGQNCVIRGRSILGTEYALIVQNSTPSNLFVVRNNGNVGIGTSNPAYTLDVVGSGDFSGGLTVTGSFQLSGSLFQYSDNTDVDIGTEVVTAVATGSYRSAFFDYVITSGSNARAGTVFSVWGGSTVEYTETSTNDIGSTTPVSLFVALNGANVELRATTTVDNWSVKSLVRML